MWSSDKLSARPSWVLRHNLQYRLKALTAGLCHYADDSSSKKQDNTYSHRATLKV